MRLQKPSGSNLSFLSAHVNLCCVGIGIGIDCVSRWMPVCLNIWSQLVTNYNFFQNTSVVLLDFPPLSDPLRWSVALQVRMSDTQLLDSRFFWSSPYHNAKFWTWSFSAPAYTNKLHLYSHWLPHYKHTQAFLPTLYKGLHLHMDINLLKPTGYVMHQQFNVQQLYVLPTLYLCFLYLSENKQQFVPLTA